MEAVLAVNQKYPKAVDAEWMKYGTAGFRDKASKLTHVMTRCGAVAVIASLVSGKKHVGLMITASHNPAPDNGVKLVAFDGAMVKPDIENIAIELVNSSNYECDLEAALKNAGATGFGDASLADCTVIIGRDTRESSAGFSTSAIEMIEAIGAKVVDLGVVTTPMLHFGVWYQHEFGTTGQPEIYFKYFEDKLKVCYPDGSKDEPDKLYFDGACGVGAVHAEAFSSCLSDIGVHMSLFNKPQDGELNSGCGSDYVQVSQTAPANVTNAAGIRCCSVDGDADRIVYHYTANDGKFRLIDGDKIAALYLKVIDKFVMQCPNLGKSDGKPLSIAVVQTAYANGGSTMALQQIIDDKQSMAQLEDVTVELRCAKTGVKNLHHIAEDYDVGIYFEANGHGTVIFKKERVMAWGQQRGITEDATFQKLISFLTLFNASVGDAFTDMLACEIGIKILGINVENWADLYEGLPCSQSKVYLPKEQMSLIIPNPEHERWLVSPVDVQEFIDAEVKQYQDCRAFVRPSGTEPLVRLYVESKHAHERDAVVQNISSHLANRFQ